MPGSQGDGGGRGGLSGSVRYLSQPHEPAYPVSKSNNVPRS
jgi:hypothetical protein